MLTFEPPRLPLLSREPTEPHEPGELGEAEEVELVERGEVIGAEEARVAPAQLAPGPNLGEVPAVARIRVQQRWS